MKPGDVLIAADIFGKTLELVELAGQISARSTRVVILDPYQSEVMDFPDEAAAYDYFQKHVGLPQYREILLNRLLLADQGLILIGFSVGASAIWCASEGIIAPADHKAICFYGSQIRHFPDINPGIEMELIFPEHESLFSVELLVRRLSVKQNVWCHTAPYRHGFMNRRSENFDINGYHEYLQFVNERTAPYPR